LKNKIIIALSIAVVILLWFVLSKDQIVKTVTTTKIEYIPQVSKIESSKPIEVKLIKIKVPVPIKTVEKTTDTIWEEKEVKKYSYLDSLSNGIIKSTIIADNIYERSIELKTFDKVITKETTNTIVQNSLFLSFGVNKFLSTKEIKDLNVSIDFTKNNKWRIGATGGYDLKLKEPFIGVKFGIPLN